MPADTEQRTATIPSEGPLIPEEEGDLLPDELYWRDHYDWLVEQGYILRERYRPGWAPKPGSGFFDGPNNPSNKVRCLYTGPTVTHTTRIERIRFRRCA